MKLAIFDIDGTLIWNTPVDDDCFVAAFRERADIELESTDWSTYVNVTDSGVIDEAFRRAYGRPAGADEIEHVRAGFVENLQGAMSADPACFTQIPGALAFLTYLDAHTEWRAAIATGGWRASATVKLQTAGIPADQYPLASADDHFTRERIVTTAIRQSLQVYGADTIDRIVLFGDAVWDARVARNLEIPLIGVDADGVGPLQNEGVKYIINNYRDVEGIVAVMEA